MKRDFGFHPHITIYDGSSRDFANLLYGRLLDLAIRFRFRVGGLSPLPSVKGQYSMDLRQAFDATVVADITGARLNVAEVDALSAERRIGLVESLAGRLQECASAQPTSERAVPETAGGASEDASPGHIRQ